MQEYADILRLLWQTGTNTCFMTSDGNTVRIVSRGEISGSIASGAQVEANGTKIRGDVVFGNCPQSDISHYTILHVVDSPGEALLTRDGDRIPQMILPVPLDIARRVSSLRNDPSRMSCAAYLGDIPGARRTQIFENLSLERLARKCGEINGILENTGGDWHQTLHVMLFRAMGGNRNREPYMKLASLAGYHTVLRERSSPAMVEALLLGTAGLLEGCYYDDYIYALRGHYEYLRNKYRIEPMKADEWESVRGRPAEGVTVRIVQLAAFLSDNDFLFDRAISCRTREDIHNLFKAEASDYWTTHYRPDERSGTVPKRIGPTKSDLLGINLIVPVMFAYGTYQGKESLKEAAVALYEQIPAESNSILTPWTGLGVALANSLDSQAILQLSNEYCARKRCTECTVGKSIIKMSL